MDQDSSQMMAMARRAFIQRSGLLIAFGMAGGHALMSPAEAAAQKVPYAYLKDTEAAIIGDLGDAIVPGAIKAGVAHFIDSQLANDANDCMLIARYFSVPPPFGDFYRSGIQAVEAVSRRMFGTNFSTLPTDKARTLAMALHAGNAPGWEGPPSSLFYQCVRSDAIDVVYGTPAGFEALGIPYMEHILPPEDWR